MRICRPVWLIALLLVSVNAYAESAIALNTRPDVVQKALVIRPDKPVAAVVLFAGGPGTLKLDGTSLVSGKGNFLVRSREKFADHGFVVVTVDAPSDHAGERGMLGGFRASTEHAQDIDVVIAHIKKEANVPVWLVGTSRGTESATNVAIRATAPVAGLVLTSSVTEPNSDGVAVTEMALDRIKTPVLVVVHKDDGCRVTPPSGAERIKKGLKNAPKVEIQTFSGGKPPKSKPCGATSQHGFLGIEAEVVGAIAAFIKSNSL
ncbi:MAG: alpha/beta hydrolase [Pseudomonadota bacterium]|nr:MAG: alpha/beta hydrolase [Pseudomonadota bacterium]